jgi:hypothetical protein
MWRIGLAVPLVAVLVAGVVESMAAAACRASASGAHSFDTRLAPQPRLCRMNVDVFEGRACGATPRWHVLLPCDQTEHLAISDRGRLISVLAPLAKRRDLNVVRVTWSAERYAWVTLDKLGGGKPFKLPARLSFEGDALKVAADRTAVIPFETVRQMASSLGD